MFETDQAAARARARSIFALSVLALLAFGCFPVLAHADSSGLQYQDAPPTVTGGTVNDGNDPSAGSSGSSGSSGGGAEGGSAADGSSKGSSGAAKNGGNGSDKGSQGKDLEGSVGGGQPLGSEAAPAASGEDDGGSSPLVPILIAILVLAAVSIGAVMYRRRRGSTPEPGSPVSPEAG
jgi:cobalamin biosynthesis Mg chelatase CobN